jgi:hypothetical protein
MISVNQEPTSDEPIQEQATVYRSSLAGEHYRLGHAGTLTCGISDPLPTKVSMVRATRPAFASPAALPALRLGQQYIRLTAG